MQGNLESLQRTVAEQVAYSAPPVGIVSANQLLGLPLSDVVLYATLLYVCIQIVVALPKLIQAIKSMRGKDVD